MYEDWTHNYDPEIYEEYFTGPFPRHLSLYSHCEDYSTYSL